MTVTVAVERRGLAGEQMDPPYGADDHLHPNDDGYTRMAQTVDLTTLDGDRARQLG